MKWLAVLVLALATALPAQAETVLRRGMGTEPETLDTQCSSGEPESYIELDLLEGLLTYDAEGRPVPGAAERWTISPDGLTYTFILRADGKWSDGSPVTADDFVFSWRRLADPKTASRYAYFLNPVKNARAVAEGRLAPDALGVAARDARTLVVTLAAPAAPFLASLAHHSLYPVNPKAVQAFGDGYTQPGRYLSNGPYVLAEAVPQDHVTLVRNPYFRAATAVAVDKVIYYPTENRDTELRRFRAGELDVTYDIPEAQIAWLRQNMAAELRIAPFLSTFYFAFNLTHEPWKSEPKLRRALTLALDRDIITGKITKSGQLPAYTLVPPGTQGYDATAAQPEWASWPQSRRNEEARRLLKEAGYGPGAKPLELEIYYSTSENYRKLALAAMAMWKMILGIKAVPVNQEWRVFLDTRNRKLYRDLARVGWIGDFNDAASFLDIYRSDAGSQNHAGYADAEFDRLTAAATVERDAGRRRDLLTRAERRLVEDCILIPVYTYASHVLVSTRVQGWRDNVLNMHPSRYLSLMPPG
ncbi:MAG: peptide ABC transporter substrate-binding protein [Azospirillaceae bacterium]|nr:peptide ABC transporter substrate-binding protein [Azospirillaceae bacterium]